MKMRIFLAGALAALLFAAVSAHGQPGGAADAVDFGGGGLFGAGGVQESQVTVAAKFTAAAAGQPAKLLVTATITPGWHIYSITQPAGGPVTTRIKVDASDSVRLAGPFQTLNVPDTRKEPLFDNLTVEEHHGEVTWWAPLEFAPGANPAAIKISGSVKAQACNADNCMPPHDFPFTAVLSGGAVAAAASVPAPAPATAQQTSVAPPAAPSTAPPVAAPPTTVTPPAAPPNNATAPMTPPAPPAAVETVDFGKLITQLCLAFVGGFILNFMPCVLPVISLKILSFIEQAGERRGRIFALNVWYAAGLMSVFLVLAMLAAMAGRAWGEQFTLSWFKVTLTGVVFVMALSFLGTWEIPIPGFVGRGQAGQLQAQEGASGAFFKGVFTTVLATPCSGPFLGPVFAYLLTQPGYVAYLVFGSVGLGMAFPYLVLGAFPELLRWMPRPGAWMETVQQLMGFLLLATVVYLFTTLNPTYFIPTLILLVGLWFACWLIGRTPLTASPARRASAWIVGLAVAATSGLFGFSVWLHEPQIAWQPYSPAALAAGRAEGKTVLVDFSANWCLTCKFNLKTAIDTRAVKQLVDENRVLPLLADWTDESPTIKQTLHELGYQSIPLLAIWPAGANKPIIRTDALTEGQVLDALREAGPSRR